MTLLSVVVPFHNVAPYLPACLDSLAAQTLDGVEFLLVDDGSTDGGAALAKQAAADDTRFRVLRQENQGAGAARNAGVQAATGTYLAFADGDDVVPPEAYARLVGSLARSGADLACGKVLRLTDRGSRSLPLYEQAFRKSVRSTHIRKNRDLIVDRGVCNKVFRRAFWDRQRFTFPPGLYEDVRVALPAHVVASGIDVLADVVYHWRVRPGSTTQRRAEPGNVVERLRAMTEVADFLKDRAPRLARRHHRLMAELDLGFLLDALDTAEGPDVDLLLDLAATTVGDLHPEEIARQPVIRRLELYLAGHGRLAELRHVRRFRRAGLKDARFVRRGLINRKWYAAYPYLRNGVPDEVFRAEQELTLQAYVDGVRVADDLVHVSGYAYIRHLPSTRNGLRLWLQGKGGHIPLTPVRTLRTDATADSDQSAVCHDQAGFTVTIDPALLPSPGPWTLHAEVRARGVIRAGRVTGHPEAGERRFPSVADLQPTLTLDQGLTLARPRREPKASKKTLVKGLAWDGRNRLLVTGPETVILKGAKRRGPIEPPPGIGSWPLYGPDGDQLRAAEGLDLPVHHTGLHEYRFQTTVDGLLTLVARPDLRGDERGRYAVRRLRTTTRHHRAPLRDQVVFDAYGGRLATCNPLALHHELRRRDTGLDLVWVTREGRFPAPEGARLVLFGSRAHEEALGAARYVVGNRTQPAWFTKRPDQTYLQTWHGTPLKRLGHDLAALPYQRTELLEWMDRDAPQWDLLVAPNPFSMPIMRRAFGYDGQLMATGYPRNDVLFAPDRAERARAVRRRLGIPPGDRVILYAPTWRDDLHTGRRRLFTLHLDTERLHEALGPGHTLLVRAHHLITHRPKVAPPTRDVTRYPEISDLYLVADVLITDYSSAMFDFACTGKPMIFFTYDLERYRDVVRGFYFDLEREAPGPLVRDTDGVIDALREKDHPDYPDFQAKFCPWDDGFAAGRVVDRLLA
ncbi:bifunctional glycosyltransferase/CDP-glycerol:glycerophosphate glycerophosphotransferase [Acrocarpospora catenulata]|uniref:bifunctional glycosyltransferase/CDP-glycerol:glycerophosphate glycerophosphotransferase n=1 Tax=Acrocarpospora catenulata TaxID=2836182 RepID=UPI001BDA76EA|nr:bifunctional glycosyltransferase/CDP-glycerol:glycerophosphate glycerophosphotransferase [Acrocarpospora catenulata]